MDFLTNLDFWFTVLRATTPVLFATMAALIASRSGMLNLGLEGAMTIAALCGVLGSGFTGSLIGSQLIGGMLAGLGGGVEMIGMYKKFQWITAQTYVWDGILINLLAGTKPLMIPVSAFFISYIRIGALVMSRGGDVDSEIVSIIQGIMIMLIASERFLYKMKKNKEEREALQNQTVEAEGAN